MSAAAAEHLDPRLLERALAGEADPADVCASLRHLAAICPDCAGRAAEVAAQQGLPSLEEALDAAPPGPYEGSIAKVLASLSETEVQIAEERLRGTLQWSALWRLNRRARETRVARDDAYHHPGFVRMALEEAGQLGQVSPLQGVAAAGLAVAVAERLAAAGRPSPALAADLEAEALGALAEARRQAGLLDAAEAALATARLRLAEGTGEPLAAAELLRREARLAVEVGDLEAALRGLDQACKLYQALDDKPAIGRVLLAQARILGPDDPTAAVERTENALALLDPEDEPHADLRGFLQLGWHLVDAGRPEEARAVLDVPQTARCRGGEPERLLRLWLTARVARALRRPAEAAPAFAEVAARWRALGRLRPRAFAVLDQAEALQAAQQGKAAAEAVRLLARALGHGGLHHQGRLALELLARRLDEGRARADTCPAVTTYLRHAWHRPLTDTAELPVEGAA